MLRHFACLKDGNGDWRYTWSGLLMRCMRLRETARRAYLYELTSSLMRFYEACPVLTSNDDVKKHSAYLVLVCSRHPMQRARIVGNRRA